MLRSSAKQEVYQRKKRKIPFPEAYTEGLEFPGQEFPGHRWNSPDKLLPAKDVGIPRTKFVRWKIALEFTEKLSFWQIYRLRSSGFHQNDELSCNPDAYLKPGSFWTLTGNQGDFSHFVWNITQNSIKIFNRNNVLLSLETELKS